MNLFPLLLALLTHPLMLRVTPQVLLPGGAVFVEAHLQPRAMNRWLRVEAEPELSVSEWSLEGAQSPRVFRRRWVATSPGDYLIKATVLDGRRQVVAYAAQRLVVAEN